LNYRGDLIRRCDLSSINATTKTKIRGQHEQEKKRNQNARINRRVGKGSTFAILPEKPRQRGEMQFGRHHCYRLITIAGFAVFPSGLKQTW
jgi:hypothetical protein